MFSYFTGMPFIVEYDSISVLKAYYNIYLPIIFINKFGC